MFGRKGKQKSNFLTVFTKLHKFRNQLEGKTIKNWNVYPEITSKQLTARTGRAEVRLYFTDATALILNTSDCDIEIELKELD